MNWIKLPIVSGAESAVAEKEMAEKSAPNNTLVNLDFYVAVNPLNGGEQSVFIAQIYKSILLKYLTVSNKNYIFIYHPIN